MLLFSFGLKILLENNHCCVGESENDVLNTSKTSKITTKILKGKLTYADAVRKAKKESSCRNSRNIADKR